MFYISLIFPGQNVRDDVTTMMTWFLFFHRSDDRFLFRISFDILLPKIRNNRTVLHYTFLLLFPRRSSWAFHNWSLLMKAATLVLQPNGGSEGLTDICWGCLSFRKGQPVSLLADAFLGEHRIQSVRNQIRPACRTGLWPTIGRYYASRAAHILHRYLHRTSSRVDRS